MKGYSISNRRLLVGSILGFIGALVIAMDKLPPIHHLVDQCRPWSDITCAMQDLNTYDHRQSDGQSIGFLSAGDCGFSALVEIIDVNRPDIQGKVVAIAQNSPMTLGGFPSIIIHVAVEGQQEGIPVATDFIFREWISKYRERYFLKRELLLVTLAFLLGIIGRIEKKHTQLFHPADGRPRGASVSVLSADALYQFAPAADDFVMVRHDVAQLSVLG
jgi:hypothetical protein